MTEHQQCPTRAWVLTHVFDMTNRIAAMRCHREGVHDERVIEDVQFTCSERLTSRFVDGLVDRHAGRCEDNLFRNLCGYFGDWVCGEIRRAAATRGVSLSIDAEDEDDDRPLVQLRDGRGDAYDVLMAIGQEHEELTAIAIEDLARADAADQESRRYQRAYDTFLRIVDGDESLLAATARRLVQDGMSPAEIAAADGVKENTVNKRLARFRDNLDPCDQLILAPLHISDANPKKARRCVEQ